MGSASLFKNITEYIFDTNKPQVYDKFNPAIDIFDGETNCAIRGIACSTVVEIRGNVTFEKNDLMHFCLNKAPAD